MNTKNHPVPRALPMHPQRLMLALIACANLFAGSALASDTFATISPKPIPTAAGESSLDGVVEAVRQTAVAAQVPGNIISIGVRAGDRVRAGQELLRIDARAAQQTIASSAAQLEAAQTALNIAARELERQKQLFEKQYISQGALDRAQAQWEAAQAQVQAQKAQAEIARTQSGFHILTAPYAGVVSEVPATIGDMAMPGRALIQVYDPATLRVTAAIPQTLLGPISTRLAAVRYQIPGLAAQDTPSAPIDAQLLPTIDPTTHTAQLRLTLPAGLAGAAPGMFARVWLPSISAPTADARLTVPASTIVRRAELTAVYVLDDKGQPRLRQVRLGRAIGDQVEVLSGVSVSDRVAADPQVAARAR